VSEPEPVLENGRFSSSEISHAQNAGVVTTISHPEAAAPHRRLRDIPPRLLAPTIGCCALLRMYEREKTDMVRTCDICVSKHDCFAKTGSEPEQNKKTIVFANEKLGWFSRTQARPFWRLSGTCPACTKRLLSQLFLCSPRACLGKLIIFSIKSLKRRRVSHPAAPPPVSKRIHRAAEGALKVCVTTRYVSVPRSTRLLHNRRRRRCRSVVRWVPAATATAAAVVLHSAPV
jgi:hypothetical protein